ncbi:MAG: hypothetical protein K0R08_336 [Solimicrobium sp.]|nr:hypothetical protein [Solimicrobium sp.]
MISFNNVNRITYPQSADEPDVNARLVDGECVLDNIYAKGCLFEDTPVTRVAIETMLITNFDTLHPDQFLEGFFVLLMSQKNRDDSSIYVRQDIQVGFTKLKNNAACTEKIAADITRLEKILNYSDVEKAIERYNARHNASHKNVAITKNVQDLPEDLYPSITHSLPFADIVSLSLTCWNQQKLYCMRKLTSEGKAKITEQLSANEIFFTCPEYRLERYLFIDQNGIDYLQQKLGVNCGPFTIQKIKNGELTIAQAKQEMQEKEIAFGKNVFELNLSESQFERLKKYLIDGSLQIEEYFEDVVFHHKTRDQIAFHFANKYVQKDLDNGKLTVQELLRCCYGISGCNDLLPVFFDKKGIQQLLDSGKLSIKQLLDLIDDRKLKLTNESKRNNFLDILEKNGIQKYLKNDKLTVKQFVDYYKYGTGTLLANALQYIEFQQAIDSGELSIDKLVQIGIGEISIVMQNRYINKHIEDNKLDPVAWTSSLICKYSFFVLKEILSNSQKYLNKGTLAIGDLLINSNPREFASSLGARGLQVVLDHDIQPIEQLLTIPRLKDYAAALDFEGIQQDLKNGKLSIDWFVNQWKKNTDKTFALAKLLSNKQVRARYDESSLTPKETYELSYLEELLELPQLIPLSTILAYPVVRECLDDSSFSVTLGKLISLPNIDKVANVLRIIDEMNIAAFTPKDIEQLINLWDIVSFYDVLEEFRTSVIFRQTYPEYQSLAYEHSTVDPSFELLSFLADLASLQKECSVCLNKYSYIELLERLSVGSSLVATLKVIVSLFANSQIRQYFKERALTVKMLAATSDSGLKALANEDMRELLKMKKITLTEVLSMNENDLHPGTTKEDSENGCIIS